ncbi:hypothetical protein IMCC9480_1611 [Oxalobacteraceae bacterium IMCC9480]|nr:hypothetical protein IMCC9480_1611 [Oxalobacteraceae bacterium IMCC9480]
MRAILKILLRRPVHLDQPETLHTKHADFVEAIAHGNAQPVSVAIGWSRT